jgi:hypothetical protein
VPDLDHVYGKDTDLAGPVFYVNSRQPFVLLGNSI